GARSAVVCAEPPAGQCAAGVARSVRRSTMPDPLDTSGQSMHAFLTQVIDRAPEVDSEGESERIVRGVLETLALAISSGQFDALTASLPPELRIGSGGEEKQARALGRTEFVDRAGGYSSSVDTAVVEGQVRAVLTTLARWE